MPVERCVEVAGFEPFLYFQPDDLRQEKPLVRDWPPIWAAVALTGLAPPSGFAKGFVTCSAEECRTYAHREALAVAELGSDSTLAELGSESILVLHGPLTTDGALAFKAWWGQDFSDALLAEQSSYAYELLGCTRRIIKSLPTAVRLLVYSFAYSAQASPEPGREPRREELQVRVRVHTSPKAPMQMHRTWDMQFPMDCTVNGFVRRVHRQIQVADLEKPEHDRILYYERSHGASFDLQLRINERGIDVRFWPKRPPCSRYVSGAVLLRSSLEKLRQSSGAFKLYCFVEAW